MSYKTFSSLNRPIPLTPSQYNYCIPNNKRGLPSKIMGVWSQSNDPWVNGSNSVMNCMYIASFVSFPNDINDLTCEYFTTHFWNYPPVISNDCIYYISVGGSTLSNWTPLLNLFSANNFQYLDKLISILRLYNVNGIDWDYEVSEVNVQSHNAEQLLAINNYIKKKYTNTFFIQNTLLFHCYTFNNIILSEPNSYDTVSFMLYATSMYDTNSGAGLNYKQWAQFLLGDPNIVNDSSYAFGYTTKEYYKMMGLQQLKPYITSKLIMALTSDGGWTNNDWIEFKNTYQSSCKGFAWWRAGTLSKFTNNYINIVMSTNTKNPCNSSFL